jgi:putative PIN family toxin of toxin-antitoxin system
MPNKQVRIIVDTNLWVSFLIGKDLTKLDKLLLSNKVRLIFSQELLDEFLEVIQRPKFKKYFSKSDANSMLAIIETFADFVKVKSTVNLCRDEKDNFLLALAIDSSADYLITGDSDLLDLKTIENTVIVQISTYLNG